MSHPEFCTACDRVISGEVCWKDGEKVCDRCYEKEARSMDKVEIDLALAERIARFLPGVRKKLDAVEARELLILAESLAEALWEKHRREDDCGRQDGKHCDYCQEFGVDGPEPEDWEDHPRPEQVEPLI